MQAIQIPASKENEMETCVLCGKTTEVPRNLSVEKREFYVEGAGQLCQSCYYELYIRKGRE